MGDIWSCLLSRSVSNNAGRNSTSKNIRSEMFDEELQVASTPPTGKQFILVYLLCNGKTITECQLNSSHSFQKNEKTCTLRGTDDHIKKFGLKIENYSLLPKLNILITVF